MNDGSPVPVSHPDSARVPLAIGIIGSLAAIKLALHFSTNLFGPYEFHRDEFLYMAMGEHLRLWSMDFPPAIALISELERGLLGDSIFAIRLFPAVLSTLILVLAAAVARDLGGGRYAQALAALCVLANTLFLRSGNLFQPVVLDQLWWTLALFAIVKLGTSENQRWWILFGTACGFGLLSKFSMLVFGLATLIGLLVSKRRRALLTPWPWYGALIAFAIGSPSFVGQIRLGFPIIDQMGDLQNAQLARVTAGEFLRRQLMWGPGAIIAAAGLVTLLATRKLRPFRIVGWTCLAAFVLLIALHGKPYYVGPIYPTLFAAGAVFLGELRVPRWSPMLRWAAVAATAAYGMVLLPLGLPVLAPPVMEEYLARLGSRTAVTTNVGAVERLPQDYADMLGWEAQVDSIVSVYHSLAPEEQQEAVLLASNYGEAGAIDFYGPEIGLPNAIAIVGTYWFFGPGDKPGNVTIAHGFTLDDLDGRFESVTPARRVTNPYAVAEQRDLTIFVCRNPYQTLQEMWPSFEGEQ
jgi:hypothetical protein